MIKTYKLKNAIDNLLKLGGMVYMNADVKSLWADIIYNINQVVQDIEKQEK